MIRSKNFAGYILDCDQAQLRLGCLVNKPSEVLVLPTLLPRKRWGVELKVVAAALFDELQPRGRRFLELSQANAHG